MYKLVAVYKNGGYIELKSNNLEGLKKTAKEYNKQGCSVEITQEICVFRIVNVQ